MSAPRKSVNLGFVNLGEDSRPKRGKTYEIISVASDQLEAIPFPEQSEFRRLNLTLNRLYIEDLPDFTRKNEGLLKIMVNTRNPQDLNSSPKDASFAIEFDVRDKDYSPTFLYRGIYRNVLFREWINLKFDLFEIDQDASEYFNKIKGVIDDVPEIKDIDALKGIPYLNVATQLFEGVIKTFGKNPDDHVWGETPILELYPGPGGAFLRKGIYILFQEKNKSRKEVILDKLKYKDGKVILQDDKVDMSNHLIFAIDIREYLGK